MVQKGIAIGMLIKIVSNGRTIYVNLHKSYNAIKEMRSKRFSRPIDRLPRRRARGDQCDFKARTRRKKYHEKD